MPVHSHRRPTVKHPVLSDMLGKRPKELLINEFNDGMIQRTKNALSLNPFMMEFYQKRIVGRKCSCMGVGDTPDAFCVSCFGQGISGGYDKYLCHTDMIDVTWPDVAMVNMMPDLKKRSVPVPFMLVKTAVLGYVEIVVKLEPNVGVLDMWKVHAHEPRGTEVKVMVRGPNDPSWVQANPKSVGERLTGGILRIRVELRRSDPDTGIPYLKGIRLRYQIMEGDTKIKWNSPIPELSQQLQDLGIWESFTTLQLFTDDTLSIIRNEDIIRNSRNGTIWKIIQVKENSPAEQTINWLVNCRQIQSFDPQFNFPF